MFFGRDEELNILSNDLRLDKQRNIIIYGRRRIGKSELIKTLINQLSIPTIFYQAKETNIEDNINSLSKIISHNFNLGNVTFDSFEDVCDYLFLKATTNTIFVIDEYPYLRNLHPGLDSVIQAKIDQYRQTSKLKIILLGSYIDIMEKLNHSDNPLYGRIDRMIFLGQLNYFDASSFYNESSITDKVKYFSVFGGMPYYNSLLDFNKSFEENLTNLILDQNGTLNDFVEFTLKQELRKVNHVNAVFGAIALGHNSYNDILGQLGNNIKSPQLANILETLIRMDLIVKNTPINSNANSRKTYYEINDNFIIFYYRYIFRYQSNRALVTPNVFFDEFIKEDFETQFVPKMFEKICYQYLVLQNKMGKINPVLYKLGKYFYNDPVNKVNAEFDLVGEDKNGLIVYEVKYTNNLITDKIVKKKIKQLIDCGIKYYRLGFFSKNGFDIKDNDYYLRTVEDLYKI